MIGSHLIDIWNIVTTACWRLTTTVHCTHIFNYTGVRSDNIVFFLLLSKSNFCRHISHHVKTQIKIKMEGNRDEAERCIAIAVQALREAKIEKAEKFLNKAEKLYPSQKAKGKQHHTWLL